MHVADALVAFGKVHQLVVVRGEQAARTNGLVQVLDDGPGQS